ncbi:DNA-binding PucR family transcriptional regulator [Mycobacterium frederiksbergense]|uniref:DNA-binding PucR family transcriptional regulator n=1 Tax=Mycolicibacterium frederiksbergense TaxID=117567 RepID=A0ABT6KS48_9MYCO|nr:DNA-binding PucR family transcriptional regulator [Mycolicibacterium frederiksbergense]
MANGGPDADVIRFVEVTADRLHDRLAELSMYIRASLEAEMPELRGDARLLDLLGASVEGNVDTLTADTDNDGRLRETLRVFLRCGSSHKLAAEELNLHFNTVKYRVGRAIERRGRPIADDRLDVELALLVCQWYGVAVIPNGQTGWPTSSSRDNKTGPSGS